MGIMNPTIDSAVAEIKKAVDQLKVVAAASKETAIRKADDADKLLAVSKKASEDSDKAGRIAAKLEELITA